MNIWIDTPALAGTNEYLLWSGALYGLKRLQQLDHTLSFDSETLTETQQQLLSNEQITADGPGKQKADLHIDVQDNQLTLEAGDGEAKSYTNWIALSDAICFPQRTAALKRNTAETNITVEVNLDGTGRADISTGLGFLDHMLEQIARHGLVDLMLRCDGDLEIDEHHTIEDVAIALGETITEALGSKVGIQRYSFVLPMDESQAMVALDLSGRPYLVFEASFDREMVGDFPTDMVEHFFYSLAMNLKATLHVTVKGKNDHHKIEACFKALARCLRASVSRSERNLNILPSTKELL